MAEPIGSNRRGEGSHLNEPATLVHPLSMPMSRIVREPTTEGFTSAIQRPAKTYGFSGATGPGGGDGSAGTAGSGGAVKVGVELTAGVLPAADEFAPVELAAGWLPNGLGVYETGGD
jgi:hypothetical protein